MARAHSARMARPRIVVAEGRDLGIWSLARSVTPSKSRLCDVPVLRGLGAVDELGYVVVERGLFRWGCSGEIYDANGNSGRLACFA